jgi:hypothetical protein
MLLNLVSWVSGCARALAMLAILVRLYASHHAPGCHAYDIIGKL